MVLTEDYKTRIIPDALQRDLQGFSPEQQRKGLIEYNYARNGHAMDRTAAPPEPVVRIAASCGTDVPTFTRERPGMSTFVLEDGVVYHAYSTYARGVDGLWVSGAPHQLVYEEPGGDVVQSRMSADTLVWQEGDVIVRIEGDIGRDRALELSAAVVPADGS